MSNQIVSILKLKLENYRNFKFFEVELEQGPIIIVGDNGAGKTNILESISFLLPGKGLRSAKVEDVCHHNCDPWSARFTANSKLGIATIDNIYNALNKKKITEFNGAKIPSTDLTKLVSVIWLTPQMDGLFLGSPGERRRFLDRIVYNFFPYHATQINKYEHLIRERAQVLQHHATEKKWLDILEEKIALIAIIIATLRIEVVNKMQSSINNLAGEFPKARLYTEGEIENKLLQNSEHLNEFIVQRLKDNRERDKASGRTSFGPHLSDLKVIHQEKNQNAELCSTGEQKAMLISLLLAQVNSQTLDCALTPIVLLDEVFVHLDNKRKEYLTEFFLSQKMQVWVTATDLAGIKSLAKKAQIIKL